MPVLSDKDFEAQNDLDTLLSAEKIQADASKMARVQTFIESQTEQFRELKSKFPEQRLGFNGAVKNKGTK